MNATRRRLLAGLGTTGLASLAGCATLDFVRGEEALRFEASAAIVADAALSDSGYREARRDSDTIIRTFEVAGQQRDVEVTNEIAEYDRSVSILGQRFRWSLFTVLSTPKVEVLGRTFNPVGDMDTDELVALIQDRYDQIGNITRDGTRTVGVLDQSAEVVRYRAEGRFTQANLRVDLTLHVTEAIEVGDDFLICLGVHPRAVDDTDAVNTLLGGVDHSDQ